MVTLSLLLVLAEAQVPDSIKRWVPSELLDNARYVVLYASPRGDTIALRRRSDRANISISIDESTPKKARQPIMVAEILPTRQTVPASGFPLGKQCLVVNKPGCYRIHSVGNYEECSVTLNGPLVKEGVRRYIRKDDFSKDAVWVESMFRASLSAYAGQRVESTGITKVNGTAAAKYTAMKSNLSYVNAKDWLSASGLRCTNKDTAQRIAFTKNGVDYVFMAGSETVKVGKAWKPMDDIVISKNGSLLVPINALPK